MLFFFSAYGKYASYQYYSYEWLLLTTWNVPIQILYTKKNKVNDETLRFDYVGNEGM